MLGGNLFFFKSLLCDFNNFIFNVLNLFLFFLFDFELVLVHFGDFFECKFIFLFLFLN